MRPLRAVEVASGTTIGYEPDVAPLSRGSEFSTPRQAFEQVLLEALQKPPCRVAFSGGLDSSLVLCVAADVARRHGLPLPIPVTAQFGAAASQEEEYQRLVLDHIRLNDQWCRLTLTDEMDLIGAAATEMLLETGAVYWPWNLHMQLPVARAGGGGGILLTGGGGDELFMPAPWHRLSRVLAGQRKLRLREVPAYALPLTPPLVRSVAMLAERRVTCDWLRPEQGRRFSWEWAQQEGRYPFGWDRAMRDSYWRMRYVQVPLRCEGAITRLSGTSIAHPFQDPRVIRAAAVEYGRDGPPPRHEGFMDFGGELLPAELLARRTKAEFNTALWSPLAARFAREAIDHLPEALRRIVDVDRVLAEWSKDAPSTQSFSLLQAAWLAYKRA